jgi:hypothetical protein
MNVWKQSLHRLYEALQNPHVELRVNCYSHVHRYTKCYIYTIFQTLSGFCGYTVCHNTRIRLNGVFRKFLRSLCIPYIFASQRFGKRITEAINIYATMELLGASFSELSMSCRKKLGDSFSQDFLLIRFRVSV